MLCVIAVTVQSCFRCIQAIQNPSYWHMVCMELESASTGTVTFKLLSLGTMGDAAKRLEDSCYLETPDGYTEVSDMPVSYTHLTLPTKRIV